MMLTTRKIKKLQQEYEDRMINKTSHKMPGICLSPKKAKEDVDINNYYYSCKLSAMKRHIRAKKR